LNVPRRWLEAAMLGAGVAAFAYWRRALTLDGALAAAAVGALTFGRGGFPAAGALLAFFGPASALSRYGERRKRSATLAQAKGSRRDACQVLANGGIATLSITIGTPAGQRAFVGALAAAAADTWATEVGLLSKRQPRSITTWRTVPAGMSGGITPEGVAASAAGALLVGLGWALCGGGFGQVPGALVAGVAGSLVDSVLGATWQALYRCTACEQYSEDSVHVACGRRADASKGLAWVTNDVVNVLATLSGAVIAGVLTMTERDETRQGCGGFTRRRRRRTCRPTGARHASDSNTENARAR
jgi:uncharacterized protein (TIGR00297 family)